MPNEDKVVHTIKDCFSKLDKTIKKILKVQEDTQQDLRKHEDWEEKLLENVMAGQEKMKKEIFAHKWAIILLFIAVFILYIYILYFK